MYFKFLIILLIANLYSDLMIENNNDAFVLKEGMLFSINTDSTKIKYESFNQNLINDYIDVSSIENIVIYNYKDLSDIFFRRILITGMALTSYVIFTQGDGATYLSRPNDIFQIGGSITLGISLLGAIVGRSKKVDQPIQIKNQNCPVEFDCTKWILMDNE